MKVKVEKQSDGTYIAYNVDSETICLIGSGDSVRDAKNDFYNSINEVEEALIASDKYLPEYIKTNVEFYFDLSSLFEYYAVINVSAFARFVGINDALMRQYKRGDTYISEKQLKKIEDGIHKLGEEFTNLRLV